MKERESDRDDRQPHFAVVDRRPSFRDDGAPVVAEERLPTVVEQMKARAEEAELRARDISAAYRRIEEERDAFRQRLSRDLERRIDLARAEMMRKVVAVLDDLDRALTSARSSARPEALLTGVELIRDRLFQVLASEGVERFETLGRPFDPELAEAVATEPTEDPARDNVVTEELEKGYMLGGALLRAARVKVGRLAPGGGPSASGAPPSSEAPSLNLE